MHTNIRIPVLLNEIHERATTNYERVQPSYLNMNSSSIDSE